MDNVVQNIRMEDIVSSNFQANQEEQKKIEELAQLIKTFGLIDPILVRSKNGKYEIVLGIEKYQAAKLAGLNNIPAIIKEVDDETFSKYLNLDNKSPQSIEKMNHSNKKNISNNNFSNPLTKLNENDNLSTDSWKINNSTKNPDIINLSELSKEEYERDDFKMNNEQLNNNMMNNSFEQPQSMSQPTQGPTFGGRFFPSLEDEPTNMNMPGNIPSQPTIPDLPTMPNNVNNNNLIDLTDLSMDKEASAPTMPNLTTPSLNNPTSEINQPMNDIQMPQNEFIVPTQEQIQPSVTQQTENIINLDSLQNNNPIVQPISEPTPMAKLNTDFGTQPQPQMQPQFDMAPNMPQQMPQAPEFSQPINNMQMPPVDLGINNPTMSQPEMSPMSSEPVSMDILNADFGVPTQTPNESATIMNPMQSSPSVVDIPTVTSPETQASIPPKDVTPVTNTIKNLVSNLEAFGYKININEEALATSIKLTIEVEK